MTINYTHQNFGEIDLGAHAEAAFCEYSKYVTQDRALPDIRDGLKPVHRRILFSMYELNNTFNKPYKKSARIIGDVLGKYHPHGDSACYGSLVRMTQPWVMSAPLADGQGNWGDTDKNSAAAMRYTEVRLSRVSNGLMDDLKTETVSWKPNYDGSEKEPEVLPARFPNLVINGVEGIGIGMASSIPPHHPVEAMNCVLALLEGRKSGEAVPTEKLMALMPAPDFPTGGVVYALENYQQVWELGQGSVRIRAEWEEELIEGRKCIVIKSLPYGVSPSDALIQVNQARRPHPETGQIALRGITGERDEGDSDGLRLVFEVNYGVEPEIALNELCNLPNSCFDISVSYNMNVIDQMEPVSIGLRQAFDRFIDFREDVVTKRSTKLLSDAKSRMHILDGFIKALDKMDQTIAMIRNNPKQSDAKAALIEFLEIDALQASKILEMTLGKLTQGEVSNYKREHEKCALEVADLEDILRNRSRLLDVIREETEAQIEIFLSETSEQGAKLYEMRRSQWTHEEMRLSKADQIPREYCSVILSQQGFTRRISAEELKEQRRGTQGTQQIELAKRDSIALATECFSHDVLAFVTSLGRIAFAKAYEIDTSLRGQHIHNLVKLDTAQDEKVIQIVSIEDEMVEHASQLQLVLATKRGMIKRTNFSLFNPKVSRTVKAIRLSEGDEVAFFGVNRESDVITLASSGNKVVRFTLSEIRETSRTSRGVMAMNLDCDAHIVSCSVVKAEAIERALIGFVSKSGQLKITQLAHYRQTKRKAKGVTAMKLAEKDQILSAFTLDESELQTLDVVSTSKKGKMNRVNLGSFRVMNRMTQGVKFVSMKDKDELISAYLVRGEKENPVDEIDEAIAPDSGQVTS
ncbi:DNA topoisomerase (ATP-hydrolyzing) subunit A [Photobacterium galatheae]|uniref:DNA topoisomerase (ATP-hydrolyzing) n=1 Tax=Photobacterium galatheae TaxID=1654360 RepID=A0A066RK62_9GAMM|nr:DNA gyrase subunit A [Photobacterium galatheae]KDM90830.1 hypothetical protein EA58_13800 [Photobacterium galatheae]MCM0149202.1 hypothetical protein [Photobacterium galatheae]